MIEADTDSQRPFLVTEYADGPSLTEYIEAHGPLGADMLYGLATGLAEALTEIHAAGVVHRDFKPSNVILAESGPKVIDFGIAQTLDSTTVTRTGMTIGSAGYMAPEQIIGRAGPAADIFAWAVTIGYASSGQPPFGTGPSDAILYRILHTEPDICQVPDRLRSYVQAALAKDPSQRPTAPDMLSQLTAATPGSSYETPTQTVLSQTWQPKAPSAAIRQASKPASRLRPLLVVLTVAVLSGGAALAHVISQHPRTAKIPAEHHLAASPAGTRASPLISVPVAAASTSPSKTATDFVTPTNSPSAAVTANSDNSEDVALAILRDHGFQSYGGNPPWDSSASLNVLIAGLANEADPVQEAYFFSSGKLVGTDTADGSSSMSATRLNSGRILIEYRLYKTGDPKCCPTDGTDTVRFYWTGSHVINLDPVPSTALRN